MQVILEQIFQVTFLAAIIRIATPLLLATLGEMLCEKSGVINLGIEGIMLFGAITGFAVTFFTGNLWLGVACAFAVGACLGAILAFLTVTCGLSQHVAGLSITLFATGLAYFIYRLIFGQAEVPPKIIGFTTVIVPFLVDIPYIGKAVFDQSAVVYCAFIAVPIFSFILNNTPFGLNLRMVGENPQAASTAGVSVFKMRYQAIMLGSGIMAVAGAFLCMAQYDSFTFGVIAGRGWVCIALVVFGQWSPWRCMLGAFLFAATDALQMRLQAVGFNQIPYEVFLIMPFLFTLIAMALVSRKATAPAALLQPFRREER